MRSKIARRIYEDTPAELKIFVRKYNDVVVRIFELLKQRGWTQKELATRLGKNASEVSKWLAGEHNLTLKTLAKLEAELGADIFYVPKKDSFHVRLSGNLKSAAPKAEPVSTSIRFVDTKKPSAGLSDPIAA